MVAEERTLRVGSKIFLDGGKLRRDSYFRPETISDRVVGFRPSVEFSGDVTAYLKSHPTPSVVVDAVHEVENGVKRFSVEVDNINLPDGTAVAVFANGTKVGTIKLVAQGGTLLLSSAAGQTVPNITVGSTVAVKFSGVKILGGKF